MTRTLRFPEETDEQFRARAERTAARYARLLVDSCLANIYVQDLIATVDLPHYTEASFRQDPVVRVDYDEAYAIGCVGECISLTKKKSWGAGPRILPLEPDDFVDHMYIGYVYKPTSRYNRRFLQRQRMKELLGKRYRPLVERAKYHRHTQTIFLENLTTHEAAVIKRVFDIDPRQFWRAARGKLWLDLPPRMVQLELFE